MGFFAHPQKTWVRRALFQIHLWTGIGVGLYVFVISVSGSAVVFRQDIYREIPSPVIIVEGGGARMSLSQLKERVEKEWPGYEVTQFYEDERNPNRAIEVTFEKGWRKQQRLFDPFTGADLGAAIPWEIRAVSWFENLHFNLFAGTTGRQINAVGAGLFTLLGLSGAVIWWQGAQRWRRGLVVKVTAGWKRFNWDLHSFAGFWTLALILMWGVTGIFVSVPDPFRAAVDYLEPLPSRPAPRPGLAQRVQEYPTPAGERQGASTGETPRAEGARGGQRGQRGARGGRPRPPQRVGDRVLRWAYDLHYGNFGGTPVKILWLILGLAPALLFVTGFLMWWNRVVRKTTL
jgi:uncharacterized iron-regulated membrane protein